MENLKFKKFVFNEGTNITVRRGTKWAGVTGEIRLQKSGKKTWKKGEILETIVVRFLDLQMFRLTKEHDPECRTYDGLYKVMQETYPGFLDIEIVTVVVFKVTE